MIMTSNCDRLRALQFLAVVVVTVLNSSCRWVVNGFMFRNPTGNEIIRHRKTSSLGYNSADFLLMETPGWQKAIYELEKMDMIAKQEAAAAGLITAAGLTNDVSKAAAFLQSRGAANGASIATNININSIIDEECLITDLTPEGSLIETKQNGKGFRPMRRNDNSTTSLEGGDLECRVVALSDAKLPTRQEVLPASLFERPHILRRLDDIYHAHAHEETRSLQYMKRAENSRTNIASVRDIEANGISITDTTLNDDKETRETYDAVEERKLVSTLRDSLEDAGFELMSRRDLDLCEALNAGYLLRLSILPDVSALDPGIAKEFYPEYFDKVTGDVRPECENELAEKLLFDGRVLVFWRGYSQEVTSGRLLLPKIDYLQASLVQRLSGSIKKRLDVFDRYLAISSVAVYRKATACFLHYLRQAADQIPNERVSRSIRSKIRSPYSYSAYRALGKLPSVADMRMAAAERSNLFKLARYGGSKIKFVGSPNPMDALNPFIICEENSDCGAPCQLTCAEQVDRDMYELLNSNELQCPYDAKRGQTKTPPMQLLDRVSISNLVDVFTREGRRKLIRTLFSNSELVEPTYQEVVVVWRPLPKEKQDIKPPKITPPKIVYELADMFDIKGLPEMPKEPPKPVPSRLEIRNFESVPMANLPAVLPKTKLVFRPADAFVFDLISVFSFLAIAGSLKFDNPKLDLIALVSVSLWLIRTVIRYSNKLARYDLLVKKFLTSKISHRNAGALKYLATEAGSQRATRAALVHTWLKQISADNDDEPLRRAELVSRSDDVNALLDDLKNTPIDIEAALCDLEDLDLIARVDDDGQLLEVIRDDSSIVQTLKRKWGSLFEGGSIKSLVSRRRRRQARLDKLPAP